MVTSMFQNVEHQHHILSSSRVLLLLPIYLIFSLFLFWSLPKTFSLPLPLPYPLSEHFLLLSLYRVPIEIHFQGKKNIISTSLCCTRLFPGGCSHFASAPGVGPIFPASAPLSLTLGCATHLTRRKGTPKWGREQIIPKPLRPRNEWDSLSFSSV